ncbi:glycoside hydrolase family 3 protein, partial [Pseudoxanthomonas sp. SGD-10]
MNKFITLIAIFCFLFTIQIQAQEAFKDKSLSFDERVEDLLKRLTLEEKVSLMLDVSKPIERLGIKEYNWWNEALHGVARAGIATVFPQPIGM